MKSTEVIIFIKFLEIIIVFFFKSSSLNDSPSDKTPLHPVENSPMNNNSSKPDCHTADILTYVKYS